MHFGVVCYTVLRYRSHMINTIRCFFHFIVSLVRCICCSTLCRIKHESNLFFIRICYCCCTSSQLFICVNSKGILCDFIPFCFHVCTAADFITKLHFVRVSCWAASLIIRTDLGIFIYDCSVIEIDFLCLTFLFVCCPFTDLCKSAVCQSDCDRLAACIFWFITFIVRYRCCIVFCSQCIICIDICCANNHVF